MTQKEQLVELIADCLTKNRKVPLLRELSRCIADYLLSHGVIVPKYKAGDKLYSVNKYKNTVDEGTVIAVQYDPNDGIGYFF